VSSCTAVYSCVQTSQSVQDVPVVEYICSEIYIYKVKCPSVCVCPFYMSCVLEVQFISTSCVYMGLYIYTKSMSMPVYTSCPFLIQRCGVCGLMWAFPLSGKEIRIFSSSFHKKLASTRDPIQRAKKTQMVKKGDCSILLLYVNQLRSLSL
jgi:hypothetical protein